MISLTKRPQRRMTNTEVVNHLMTFSRRGALAQLFVIDALAKVAEAVANSKPEDYPPEGWVHGPAWIDVATEIRDTLDKHLSGPGLMTDADPDDDGLEGL